MLTSVLVFLILAYSIILHELSHGVVAEWNGDPTARAAGRITLNPLPHIDPIGTVALPLILTLTHAGIFFAWAKPVPFDPRMFRNRRLGIFTVGIAGPVTNLILAALFAFTFRAVGPRDPLAGILFYGAFINVLLAVFNLIPIPPLDGSRAVSVFLPKELKKFYHALEPWGFFIVMALLFSGALNIIAVPVRQMLGLLTGIH